MRRRSNGENARKRTVLGEKPDVVHKKLLELLVDVFVGLLDGLGRGTGDDVVVAWVLVDSDVIERAGEPLKKRFLVSDGAENDLVVDTLDDILGQIGLDAAQNLRFVLISIPQSYSFSLTCSLDRYSSKSQPRPSR